MDRTRKCGKVYIGQNQRCRESAKRRKRERESVCVSGRGRVDRAAIRQALKGHFYTRKMACSSHWFTLHGPPSSHDSVLRAARGSWRVVRILIVSEY